MKPLLGDSEQDGNLLLGGLGSSQTGAAGRVAGSGRFFKRSSGRSLLTAESGRGGGGRYEQRNGRDFRNEK